MITEKPVNERLQWFLDRIGKRVFRNHAGCPCVICKKVYEQGFVIVDASHAEYVHDNEADYAASGHPLRYFDTKEQALAYEAENPLPNQQKLES